MLNQQVVTSVKKAPKGCHIVLFYNSQEEKHRILFTFIKHGLENGEAVIYLSDEQSPRQITKDISTFGIDVDKHEKTGALRILNGENWFAQNGTINKELVVKKWAKAFSDATANGFCGLRVSGEPTYFFRHNILEPWMEYERSLPRTFDFPITAICRYRTRDLASHNMSYLLELIRIHSHTITPTSCQNIDFQDFFPESVENAFKHILGESGTHAVYHYIRNEYKLHRSNIANKMSLFNEALNNLFGTGAAVLQEEVLKDVCSKLGITFNLRNEHSSIVHSKMEATP